MCDHDSKHEPEPAPGAAVVAKLAENHRVFLSFVERRVGSRDAAEEILQNALVKNVEKFDAVRESATAWFYKVLRNAIIDYRRRKTVADKRLEDYVASRPDDEPDPELQGVVCKCVGELASTLKPEYADALREVEIDGVPVKDFAERHGISASNAGVRVFRAREALRKQVVRSCGTCATHGCLDCTCEGSPPR